MATIYCHINKINNKKYVGISSSSVERRWNSNGSGYKGSYFYEQGINQYGWDNFIHLILTDDVPLEIAEQVEARLIKLLDSTNKDKGYNDSPGAKICINENADILTNLYYEKIINTNNNVVNKNIPLVDYSYDSPRYAIDFLVDLDKKGQLNTDLDCQRGYVWTSERQQGMWDTLLRGHRIPECHAVRTSKNGIPVYEIIDGKQRLTTVLKIVNNEIPFNKRDAAPMYTALFEERPYLYYKDLPAELQSRILTTAINFAIYINISDEDLVVLFRKLNASAPLSDFSKGIASCITMRTKFTRYLIKHPVMKNMFKEHEAMKSEDELFLIRFMFLLRYGCGNVSLTPMALSKKYEEFSGAELTKYRDIILDTLEKYSSCADTLKTFNAKNSYLPIIFYYFVKNNISPEEANVFVQLFVEEAPGVRGQDFIGKYQNERYNIIEEYFNN